VEEIVDKRRRGKIPKRVWRRMKRRAVIESAIEGLKNEHRMERNKLRGLIGDKITAIPSAVAMNFGKIQAFLLAFFSSSVRTFSRLPHLTMPQNRLDSVVTRLV
jgi:IS5 family transposase